MNIYTLLDEMDKLLDDGLNLPFTGGKSVIDTESARSILDDLRNTIPQEVRQARAITADRNQILADAKRDGEGIKNKAKEQAERLVSETQIVKQAQEKAKEIINQAQQQSNDIKKSTKMYVENFMKDVDQQLTSFSADFHKMRQSIKFNA